MRPKSYDFGYEMRARRAEVTKQGSTRRRELSPEDEAAAPQS